MSTVYDVFSTHYSQKARFETNYRSKQKEAKPHEVALPLGNCQARAHLQLNGQTPTAGLFTGSS